MANQIVTVNVQQQVAPAPIQMQKKGALISQGATTTAVNALTLLTQAADLTAVLKGALALSSITWSGGVATATTTVAHGLPNAEQIQLTIAGATPAGYNGTYVCTITGASTFTYALAVNPGLCTVPGSWTPEDVDELHDMVQTFFAQGSQQAVWVLELGAGNAADGVTALNTFLAANPGAFYGYLVPRNWADEATFRTALIANFETATSLTYFWTTMTLANYGSFTSAMKCVVGLVEAPALGASEFTLAAAFFWALNYAPSTSNRVTPFAFAYLFGVTPYPTKGNNATLALLQAASVNYVATGAEGGISNAILWRGTTMDANDFTYWYSVDWVQVNVDQAVANAVITGSNTPSNPLYYNQDGINRLQAIAAATMASGVAFGLVLGAPVQTALAPGDLGAAIARGDFAGQTIINAVPFATYARDNPSDYRAGNYAGLSIVYVPARGFLTIVFNVLVSQLPTA